MSMEKENIIEEKANKAIKELRISKLQQGQSFMSSADHLPDMQAIYEHPEGVFRVMDLIEITKPLKFIRMATPEEIFTLKENNPIYGN